MMRKYAVLGATGATGSELTTHLLRRNDVQLHIYARSASRVSAKFPDFKSSPNARAFIGPLSDIENLAACLDGIELIYSAVAQNANEPGCSVACDTAHALVSALEELSKRAQKEGKDWKSPKLVLLASATLNPANERHEPWLIRKIIEHAGRYVYEDLCQSIRYLEAEAPWLPVIIAAPAGLVQSKEEGFEIGDCHSLTLGYADLAGAMIAMGEQDSWEGKYVGIKSLGAARTGLLLQSAWSFLLPGLATTSFPWMFEPLKRLGFLQ